MIWAGKLRRTEPLQETRPNFSRVTPAQLSHIVFPKENRYQPVRILTTNARSGRHAVSRGPIAMEKYAGGGGILILSDSRPGENAEFIELAPEPQTAPAQAEFIATPRLSGLHIALDENASEAEAPPPFEVRYHALIVNRNLIALCPVSFRT
jgi:26S proteasome regulatory subunit N2